MTKDRIIFECEQCGHTSPKWVGRCPHCDSWNTFVQKQATKDIAAQQPVIDLKKISDIDFPVECWMPTGISEFDRVLGNGILKGSTCLIAGEPGIGKTTLLMQVADAISRQGKKVFYFSGEESLSQLYQRARRIHADSGEIFLANTSEVNSIVAAMETECPDLLIVDSIQTVYDKNIASSAGSIIQVRSGTLAISSTAKNLGVSTILISHITKEGSIAGPKITEHIVDAVISFEGDENRGNRILRSSKNRFSSTNEVGIFEMTEMGLTPIENPSKFFLSERIQNSAGSVVMPTIAGVRPILVEIQALVSRSHDNYPRRSSNGIDYNRAMLMVAVLEKRAGLKLYSSDVYLNVASGMRISEPACDLPVAVAIASSYYGIPVDPGAVIFGEVGLGGEVRSVCYTAQRLNEIESLGFDRAFSPKSSKKVCRNKSQLDIIEINKIEDALSKLGIKDNMYASGTKER